LKSASLSHPPKLQFFHPIVVVLIPGHGMMAFPLKKRWFSTLPT